MIIDLVPICAYANHYWDLCWECDLGKLSVGRVGGIGVKLARLQGGMGCSSRGLKIAWSVLEWGGKSTVLGLEEVAGLSQHQDCTLNVYTCS